MHNFDSLGGYWIVLKFSHGQLVKIICQIYMEVQIFIVFKVEDPLCLLLCLSSHDKNSCIIDLCYTDRYLN